MTPGNNRFYKPLLAAVAIVLICTVSFSQRYLNKSRDELGLTRVSPLENAPPVLAFTTVALGGFRGLIANMLWIRLADLQDEDKYFEMVQLADWITKLQPHFKTVWVHLAWNMSYNISIKFTDPADRWLWVSRGIELLRDEGLKYNPKEPELYRELAWHFQHKLGQNLDDAHNYYKAIWAEQMDKVFGKERPNFQELIAPQTEDARGRSELLREKFKMNPVWMKEVDEKYGPLEWRLPETHAVYWGYVGLEHTQKDELKKDDLIKLRRVIFQSMQTAFHRGRLVYPDKSKREFIYAPNLDIVRKTNQAYEEMMELEPQMRDNIATAHKNFLKTAVYFLYVYSRASQAKEWFDYVNKKYPQAIPPNQDLDTYALERVTEDVGETSHDRVKAILEGLLTQSFIYLSMGEEDIGTNYDGFARRIWQRFESSIGKESKGRVGLPPFQELRQQVLAQLLDPQTGLETTLQNQLRTKLGLPPASTTSTNSPSALNGAAPKPAANAPAP
jgi:hypothetical protein